jgi:hypothetical protein
MRGEVNRECIMDFAWCITRENTLLSGLAIDPTFGKRGCMEECWARWLRVRLLSRKVEVRKT